MKQGCEGRPLRASRLLGTCHTASVEVRGQLTGVRSLLPPCSFKKILTIYVYARLKSISLQIFNSPISLNTLLFLGV